MELHDTKEADYPDYEGLVGSPRYNTCTCRALAGHFSGRRWPQRTKLAKLVPLLSAAQRRVPCSCGQRYLLQDKGWANLGRPV